MRKLTSILIASAIAAVGICEADAATVTYDFFATNFFLDSSAVRPYGIPEGFHASGSITIDPALSGKAAFQSLSYTTGTRTWTLDDLTDNSFVYVDFGEVLSFGLVFDVPGNFIYAGNTAFITDPATSEYYTCSECVTYGLRTGSAVPEPASWALMLVGTATVGFGMRRRHANSRTAGTIG